MLLCARGVPGGRNLVKGFLPAGSVVRWSSVRTLHDTSGAYTLKLRLKEAFLIHSSLFEILQDVVLS